MEGNNDGKPEPNVEITDGAKKKTSTERVVSYKNINM